jgi:hypothetical protein
VLARSHNATVPDVLEPAKLQAVRLRIEHHCQLGEQVLSPVLEGEKVTPEEFAHKVFLAESEQGFITQYEVLVGNLPDQDHVPVSLEHQRATIGHPRIAMRPIAFPKREQ